MRVLVFATAARARGDRINVGESDHVGDAGCVLSQRNTYPALQVGEDEGCLAAHAPGQLA